MGANDLLGVASQPRPAAAAVALSTLLIARRTPCRCATRVAVSRTAPVRHLYSPSRRRGPIAAPGTRRGPPSAVAKFLRPAESRCRGHRANDLTDGRRRTERRADGTPAATTTTTTTATAAEAPLEAKPYSLLSIVVLSLSACPPLPHSLSFFRRRKPLTFLRSDRLRPAHKDASPGPISAAVDPNLIERLRLAVCAVTTRILDVLGATRSLDQRRTSIVLLRRPTQRQKHS